MTTPAERDDLLRRLYAEKDRAQRAGESDRAAEAQEIIDSLQHDAVLAQKQSSASASLGHYAAGTLNRIGQGISGGYLDEMVGSKSTPK